ncbi:hypothetical protein [Mycolicibacterium frederiksbergense]|uniref:hypothetical protein n=1 Tax=Mycolicibacterium frederiksbergense TaxID=117567 RepID=UPI0024740B93|nr:hypothetical protein [Mycolicibacterium frederiksbergense]
MTASPTLTRASELTTQDTSASPAAGTFCSKDLEGKTGTASDGSTLTCTAGSDGRDRWTASAGAPGEAAAAGTFCNKDLVGKTAKASDGSTLTCTAGSDGRDRWTAK